MAVSMRVGSVETPCAGFGKNWLSVSSRQLEFAPPVASAAGFLRRRRVGACGRRGLKISCEGRVVDKIETLDLSADGNVGQLTSVMKFGGSSLASAERMREVAELILSFPEERPVIVLSAMGKTTNKLLNAGEKAVGCGVSNVSEIDELSSIKELHLITVDELGVDRSTISAHLDELEQLLKGIAMMKEMTLRTKDYLVSFGECMSTRIFAAYLNKIGAKARQYDAFHIGFITTDDFTNADILEATYPAVAKRLHGDWILDPAIPIVTGFLGKGWKSCAVTTLGRGGSDLTATTIGKALGLREIQVWKDVDGVLTCDPNIYPHAEPVPYLTFDEAAELAYFGAQVLHPQSQSMRPAREGDIPVRVKNSYNPKARGTLITKSRDMTQAVGQAFALTHEEAEAAGNVVEGTLSICDQNARVLFDTGSTHSYVSSAFASVLGGVGEELPWTLVVYRPQGKSLVCQTYYPRCRVQIGEYIMFADLIVLPMHKFDVILGMDWLARYRAVMDCFEKTVKLTIDGSDDTIEFVGERRPPGIGLISALKAERLVRSGCEGYIAFISEDKKSKGVEEIPVVCELQMCFPTISRDCLQSERSTSPLSLCQAPCRVVSKKNSVPAHYRAQIANLRG